MSNDQSEPIYIRVDARSPLLLGDRSSIGNYLETTDFIPGSALRGAAAGRLLAACGRPDHLHDHTGCPDRDDCPFWQLFGADEPLFGNAYPGGFGPAWPLPLTARTCKRYPGLSTGTEADKRKHHGVWDALFADFAYDLVSDPAFPQRDRLQPALAQSGKSLWLPERRAALDKCPAEAAGGRCGKNLVPANGYYTWKNGPRRVETMPSGRATHVGINRARSVAEDELLFSQRTLDPQGSGQAFFATVHVPAGKRPLVEEALLGTQYVGRGRSRGYGEVAISGQKAWEYPGLERRLALFQEGATTALTPYRQDDNDVQGELPGRLFSLTLRAPAILSEAGRPLRSPSLAMLGLPEGVSFLRAWARTEQVGGWDSAAQLPRRTQLAARAGSVFLYFAPNSIGEDELLAALARLEAAGVGLERERGYGQLTVCAAFHEAAAFVP
jgi:CRISPR-associated protein Csx10